MKKRIFITGAAGFIGFHVAKACLEAGYQVTAIDNFNAYYDVSLKEGRAKNLKALGLEVHRMDVNEREKLQKLIEENESTHIIHLGAQAGVRYSFQHPEVFLKSNIDGFLNILEVCRRNPKIKLVYASSSSVYGANTKIPFSIDDPTDQQTNVYGVTKKTNELMAYSYHHLYQVPSVGLRFFTVYGPWGRPDMAVFSFTKAISEKRPIDVYNHGNCRRDFTYIDDVVSAILASLDYKEGCSIFNIGNENPQSVNTLIEIIENNVGNKALTRQLPMQQGEILETFADIDITRKELGYNPKTNLEEGIAQFVQWYRQYYE